MRYVNSTYGIAINYPVGWTANDGDKLDSHFFITGIKSYFLLLQKVFTHNQAHLYDGKSP